MTDQVRRDESAESELLDTLLDAADAPVDQPAAATPEVKAEAAAQPTPETAAQDAAAEAANEPIPEETAPVTAETAEAEPVTAELAETTETAPETEPVTAELAETAEAEPVSAEAPAELVTMTAEADPVAPPAGTDETPAAEPVTVTAEAPAAQTAEADPVAPPAGTDETPAAEPVTVTAEADPVAPPAGTDETPAAEPVTAESPDAEFASMPALQVPSDDVAPMAPAASVEQSADAAAGAAEDKGASFTPVAEEGGVRPRKLKDLQAGMELDGRVTSIALYGVFVDIGVGRDGLVHISEMSDTRIDTPSDIVAIGDTVKVKIKSVDPDARRISLTMRSGSGEKSEGSRSRSSKPKRAEVDKDRLGALKVGDVVDGTITGFAPFGAFADIGVGKDGLVHVSELAEGRVEKAEDAVKVGDRFQFKVLEVDPDGNRISLSLRRAQRTQKMQQLEPGQILDGTVSGIAPFGAFVDIGVGRDGLVHISALSTSRVNKVEDMVKVGDKVTVRVIEVDQQSKRISLTMRLDDSQSDEGGDNEEYSSNTAGAPRQSSSASPARFASAAEARAGRDRERERRERQQRERRNTPSQPETYSTEEVEQEFVGDATLEDLMAKFGSPATAAPKRDRKGAKRDDESDDEGENRDDQRQRDAIKRTLQQVGRDE